MTGLALGIPVVYARKTKPVTMHPNTMKASAPSHTKGVMTELMISPEFLGPRDHVLVVDDFLARGETIRALVDLVKTSGASLIAIGAVVEKRFEGGRAASGRSERADRNPCDHHGHEQRADCPGVTGSRLKVEG